MGSWKSEPLECQASIWKMLFLLLLVVAMMAASIFCLLFTPDWGTQIAGGVGVVFFGLGGLVISTQATFKPPRLVFDEGGIFDSRLGCGLIAWSDIRHLRFQTIQYNTLLCVDVKNPEEYLSRMPTIKRWLARLNRQFGFSALTIGLTGLRPGSGEIEERVHKAMTERATGSA